MTVVTAALAMAVVALLVPLTPGPPPRSMRARRHLIAAAALGAVALGVLAAGASPPMAGALLTVLGTGVAMAQLARAVTRRRAAAATSVAVLEVCDLLRDEIGAGQPPLTALRRAVDVWQPMSAVADAAAVGLDVPEALRSLAATPGAESLRLVAGAWVVSHRAGRGLADALDLVSRTLRGTHATRRLVDGELASARATARLLAVLPILALLVGGPLVSGAGQTGPWHFLLATPPGVVCLTVGLGFGIVGLWWIEVLARDVVQAL